MGVKDTVTKDYMMDPNVFADLFNQFLYDGEEVITPERLHRVNTTALTVPYGADGASVPIQKFRDEFMCLGAMEDSSAVYLLIGSEYQVEQHYAMPVKDMVYDAASYASQVEAAAASHRAEAKKVAANKKRVDSDETKNANTTTAETTDAKKTTQKAPSSGEFLSGFYKEDRLVPVITVVVHFSPEKWDAPRSLHEMFQVQDEKILSHVPDYKINLISPAEMSDKEIGKFKTNLREVLFYIKYCKDKEKLRSLVANTPGFRSLDIKATRLLNTLTGSKLKFSKKEEVVNMRYAIDEIAEDAKNEGITIGISRNAVETALRMLKALKYPLEEISDISGLSLEEVQELQKKHPVS